MAIRLRAARLRRGEVAALDKIISSMGLLLQPFFPQAFADIFGVEFW